MAGRAPEDAEATLGSVASVELGDVQLAPVLTILAHPDAARVGERSRLNDPGGNGSVRLSRSGPAFGPVEGADRQPLGDPHLSRNPVLLALEDGGAAQITPPKHGSSLRVNDEITTTERSFHPGELERGVVLQLGDRVVLLLHRVPPRTARESDLGMVGASQGIAEVRRAIRRVAGYDMPVMLRGESGTGKDLVARAIHAESRRGREPFIAVNMAALAPHTAAAELFGYRKGAFTGADADRIGWFGNADGGTLFLDEIADTPPEVQPALLRALESGEVQPLGGAPTARDVRIITATDADLERAVACGRFRLPLMQRLNTYEIHIPPLRQRREDVGRLLYHWLGRALDEVGLAHKLAPQPGSAPWLPAQVVARAALAPWEGNVRQLRNVARSLVIDWGDAKQIPSDTVIARWFPNHAPDDAEVPPLRGAPSTSNDRRSLNRISDDELIAALRAHDYQTGRAAEALGVSRTSIYALIEASARVRKAADLTSAEVEEALSAFHGEVAPAARQLEVSERALRLRMRQLKR